MVWRRENQQDGIVITYRRSDEISRAGCAELNEFTGNQFEEE